MIRRLSGVSYPLLITSDGSAGSPILSWASDPNTGIYRVGADQLGFSAGGTERFRINTTEVRCIIGTFWNRTYRDTGGSQRLDFGASSTNVYTSQAAASGVGHSFECQTAITSGKIASFKNDNGVTERAAIDFAGKLIQDAGDSSASPGAATVNKPVGKSAVALGASSVVITNSNVTANSLVFITPLDLDATLTNWKVAAASGSFTVTGNANATAAWKFNWQVIN